MSQQILDLLQYRVDQANAVIKAISDHGDRLMYSDEYRRTSRFDTTSHGRVWFIDHHTGMQIYPRSGLVWDGFTSDATARKLVEALSHYIQTGKPIDAEWTAIGENALGYDKEAIAAVRMDLAHCKAVQLMSEK